MGVCTSNWNIYNFKLITGITSSGNPLVVLHLTYVASDFCLLISTQVTGRLNRSHRRLYRGLFLGIDSRSGTLQTGIIFIKN